MKLLNELFPKTTHYTGEVRPIIESVIEELDYEMFFIVETVKNYIQDHDRVGHIGKEFGKRMNPLQGGNLVEIDSETEAVVQSMHYGNDLALRSPFDAIGNDDYLDSFKEEPAIADSFNDKKSAQRRVALALAATDNSASIPTEYRK
jgi:hypothetical protein